MAFPSEEARTLRPHPIAALGQYLPWFLFLRGGYSEVYLIWVYYYSSSLLSAFPLTQAPHLEQDFLLPLYFYLSLKLVWLCSFKGTKPYLVRASGICQCLATLAPSTGLVQMPSLSFTLSFPPPNTAHLTSLHILQHSITFYCSFPYYY